MPRFSELEASAPTPAKEYLIPAALIAAGICISAVYGLAVGGASGFLSVLIYTAVTAVFQVALGIVACLITARAMGVAFGYAGSAILKLAAIFIFPSAVAILIPSIIGKIVGLIIYWGLIEWLFELDALETIVFAIVIWLVNIGALLLVAVAGFSFAR